MRGAAIRPPAPSAAYCRKRRRDSGSVGIVYLLRNSGDASSSASARLGLSARSMASVVASPRPPGKSCGPSTRAVDAAAGERGQALRQLDPTHQRVGRGPAGADVVVAGRRSRSPRRLTELRQHRRDRAVVQVAPAEAAQRRQRPFPRRLELGRRRLPGLGRFDQGAIDAGQIAAAALEGVGETLDQRRRRLVAGEMARQLGGDVACRRLPGSEVAQDRLAWPSPAAS